MENYKVSLLIPVYNAENHIERCAESIFAQTYANLEYIFVNDGSTDNSINVVQSVLKKFPGREDKVIIVDHITNRGISAARNTAIAAAHGAFVMFVDSDDWLDLNAVEKCVDIQHEKDADIVTMSHVMYTEDSTQIVNEVETNLLTILHNIFTLKCTGRIWGRLIRRNLICDNELNFIEGADNGEDLMMMAFLCYYANKHSIVQDVYYNYDHSVLSSYTQRFLPEKSLMGFSNVDAVRMFFEKKDNPALNNDVKILNALTIVEYMIWCSSEKCIQNEKYYKEDLLRRLGNVEKPIINQLPLRYRFICFLKSFDLVHAFVKFYRYIKHLLRIVV